MWLFNSKPMATKRFAALFAAVLLFLFLYHTAIYLRFTSKVLNVTPPEYIGDLVRLSYQSEFIDKRVQELTLPRRHDEGAEYQGGPVDILTVGDSFSNGGAGGRNPYYQDYIASEKGLNVLNIRPLKSLGGRVAETLLALDESGVLERIAPKIVILGSGSREIVRRFGGELPWHPEITAAAIRDEMAAMRRHVLAEYQLQNVPILNTANYKFLYYSAGYRVTPCMGRVCRLKLKRELFSAEAGNELLFFRKTLSFLPEMTPGNIGRANDNLNRIARRLEAKGIRLYLMLSVSKYDLYYDEIAQNPFPPDPLFGLLETLPKAYTLIDTKKILKPMVERGERDVFYADDTHWSFRASEAIVKATSFE